MPQLHRITLTETNEASVGYPLTSLYLWHPASLELHYQMELIAYIQPAQGAPPSDTVSIVPLHFAAPLSDQFGTESGMQLRILAECWQREVCVQASRQMHLKVDN